MKSRVATPVVLNWGERLLRGASINFQGDASPYSLYYMESFWTVKSSVRFTHLKSGGWEKGQFAQQFNICSVAMCLATVT